MAINFYYCVSRETGNVNIAQKVRKKMEEI